MKFVRTLILILIGAVTFGLTMTFAGTISGPSTIAIRVGLIIALGSLWLTARGSAAAYRPIFFAYFAIAAGLTVAWYGEEPITKWLALGFTPFSNAAAKCVQAALITTTVLILTLASGQRLDTLYLSKGRLLLGLGLGVLGFLVFIGLTFLPGGPFFKAASFAGLKVLAPAAILFALSNAFMEELLFRGLLLKRTEALTGPWTALFATTLVFALAHMQVTYTAQVFGFMAFVFALGLMWGLLMQKSKSLWGSVLFHAGADVAVILPIYQAMLH